MAAQRPPLLQPAVSWLQAAYRTAAAAAFAGFGAATTHEAQGLNARRVYPRLEVRLRPRPGAAGLPG